MLFPYLGGSASSFLSFAARSAYRGEILAVTSPGHLGSPDERFCDDLHSLADAHFDGLDSVMGPGSLFLGYSMGGLAAFETALRFRDSDPGRAPLKLVIMACGAPDQYFRLHDRPSDRDDQAFLEHLFSFGVLPESFRVEQELLAPYLPAIRSDQKALDSYRPGPDRWDRELAVVVADSDPLVSPAEAHRWRSFGTGPFSLSVVPGDHMFLLNRPVPPSIHQLLER